MEMKKKYKIKGDSCHGGRVWKISTYRCCFHPRILWHLWHEACLQITWCTPRMSASIQLKDQQRAKIWLKNKTPAGCFLLTGHKGQQWVTKTKQKQEKMLIMLRQAKKGICFSRLKLFDLCSLITKNWLGASLAQCVERMTTCHMTESGRVQLLRCLTKKTDWFILYIWWCDQKL